MNDTELVALVRQSVAEVHATTPVAQIISRGHAARTRRRLAGAAGLTAGVAAGSALIVGLTGVLGASPGRNTGATRPPPSTQTVRTGGFVLTANANGTLTLTLSQVIDPVALQQALAQHGIPALVKDNTFCASNPAAPDPTSSGVLTVQPPFRPKAGLRPVPPSPVYAHGHSKNADQLIAHTKMVINPAAMPAGTELFFGYAPGDHEVAANLIYTRSYTCSSLLPQAGIQLPNEGAKG
jgi:hypothetical protein